MCNVSLIMHMYPHEVCGNLKTTFYLQCLFVSTCQSEVDRDSYRHGLGSGDKTLYMVECEPIKPWASLS